MTKYHHDRHEIIRLKSIVCANKILQLYLCLLPCHWPLYFPLVVTDYRTFLDRLLKWISKWDLCSSAFVTICSPGYNYYNCLQFPLPREILTECIEVCELEYKMPWLWPRLCLCLAVLLLFSIQASFVLESMDLNAPDTGLYSLIYQLIIYETYHTHICTTNITIIITY